MDRSRMMAAVRSKDTQPEMLVRRLVHSMGYRYRLHAARLPGKPDLVFVGKRKIIFVHGCFWHQHSGCKGSHLPKSNQDYWLPKLERNRVRDAEHLKALRGDGWRYLILWECELCKGAALRRRISRFLG
jgi:DNA mismatch endonuclease (patch repair protein)